MNDRGSLHNLNNRERKTTQKIFQALMELEPATVAIPVQHCNQLSYEAIGITIMETKL